MTDRERSLHELCSQPPLFEFEGFVIHPFDDWNIWMENPRGEGSTIRRAEFLATLAKLFERNF